VNDAGDLAGIATAVCTIVNEGGAKLFSRACRRKGPESISWTFRCAARTT
jgi:hypothetical protein